MENREKAVAKKEFISGFEIHHNGWFTTDPINFGH